MKPCRFVSAHALRLLAVSVCLLLASDAYARPGGGSSYGGRSSSSSSGSRSSSSSGSRSSGSSGSSSRSSSNSGSSSRSSSTSSRSSSGSGVRPSGGYSVPVLPAYSYQVRAPEERLQFALLRPTGSLGPYGPESHRPAELPVEHEASALAVTITLLVAFGIVATPLVVLFLILRHLLRRQKPGWSTAGSFSAPAPATSSPTSIRQQLQSLRRDDPDFSIAVLEDFLYALYAEAHTARGNQGLWKLTPWLAPQARQELQELGTSAVSTIIVGAMRLCAFNPNVDSGTRVSLTVEFEACYTETAPGQPPRSFFALERWSLVRARSARSRAPDNVRVFNCPSCGAPLDRLVGNACQYCNHVVDGGTYDWTVQFIELLERNERAPMLTGTTEEVGTDRRTIVDPSAQSRLVKLKARDPSFSEQSMQARVALIFQTMQHAWSSLEWHRARPFLSDMLFETQSYWINAYRTQGLRNITENARITGMQLVRVGSDRWFDTITLRVWATGLDYTVRDADHAVVGGNRTKERAYSEYWTLIRGTGRSGPTRLDSGCPNCGAPLVVNMAAICSHCSAKVNSGAFDWVLSRIEQDESYEG